MYRTVHKYLPVHNIYKNILLENTFLRNTIYIYTHGTADQQTPL